MFEDVSVMVNEQLHSAGSTLLAEKISEPYALTIAYIHCRFSFALLRASVMCMRGSRSLCSARDEFSQSAMVAVAEANIRH